MTTSPLIPSPADPSRFGFEDSAVPQSRVDLAGRILAVNRALEVTARRARAGTRGPRRPGDVRRRGPRGARVRPRRAGRREHPLRAAGADAAAARRTPAPGGHDRDLLPHARRRAAARRERRGRDGPARGPGSAGTAGGALRRCARCGAGRGPHLRRRGCVHLSRRLRADSARRRRGGPGGGVAARAPGPGASSAGGAARQPGRCPGPCRHRRRGPHLGRALPAAARRCRCGRGRNRGSRSTSPIGRPRTGACRRTRPGYGRC